MAEQEQAAFIAHNQSAHCLNERVESDTHSENTLALWMAFVLCMTAMLCGTALILNGFIKSGLALLGTTLAGLAASFLKIRKK